MYRYLERNDVEDIRAAVTYEGLHDIAVRILERMPQPVAMVCGPITTGGGTLGENLASLQRAIDSLLDENKTVFVQLLFESAMHRIQRTPYYRDENQLLEGFYQPLFESGLIKKLYFLPTWRESEGARWEHAQAFRLNMEIEYIT